MYAAFCIRVNDAVLCMVSAIYAFFTKLSKHFQIYKYCNESLQYTTVNVFMNVLFVVFLLYF